MSYKFQAVQDGPNKYVLPPIGEMRNWSNGPMAWLVPGSSWRCLMPDENKFEKLREVGYKVQPTCVLCVHGNIAWGQLWGSCRLHRYSHLKHANPADGREMSIHIAGSCSFFEASPSYLHGLGAFNEFLAIPKPESKTHSA